MHKLTCSQDVLVNLAVGWCFLALGVVVLFHVAVRAANAACKRHAQEYPADGWDE